MQFTRNLVWENGGFVKGWGQFIHTSQIIWFGRMEALLRADGYSYEVHE